MLRVNIYGQNGFQKQGNVLLDSGAQVSLVREETATMLGLKGKGHVGDHYKGWRGRRDHQDQSL